MTLISGKPVREGSAVKRAAILEAARARFLADGSERTSMDAIAESAGVSKRTVYDYYGDKRALLLAVVEQAGTALLSSIVAALDANLTDLTDAADVEESLVAFARSISDDAIGSPDYTALIRLVTMESAALPELREHSALTEPETILAERLAELGTRGLLDVPNPRRAADHFVALTLTDSPGTISRTVGPDKPGIDDVDEMIRDGVRVFLKAYRA